MLIKLLKTNKPSSFIALLLFALMLLIINWLFPHQSTATNNDILLVLFPFFSIYSWLSSLALFLLSFVMALSWNRFVLEHVILKNSGYILAFSFLLTSSFFSFSSTWVVNCLFLFLLQTLMNVYNKKTVYRNAYDAGFLLGLSCLIYVPSFVFIVTIYLALFIYSSVSWRSLLLPLIGVMTPVLFLFSYGYYFDLGNYLLGHYASEMEIYFITVDWTISSIIFSLFVALLTVLAIAEIVKWYGVKNLKARKTFSLLFSYCVCFIVSIFFTHRPWEHFLLLSLPLSLFFANYFFHSRKRWWYESTFVVLCLLSLYFKTSLYFSS